jgi:type II secretory pathway predicted ATPase ExeA
MYYAHFGLVHPPFRITPDTTLFFSGAERGSMLEALTYVVLSGEGITKVIGEVGSGKTMLCRMLEEKLPRHVETIYIANPNIEPDKILSVLAFEAGYADTDAEGEIWSGRVVYYFGAGMPLMQRYRQALLP